jgi:hypothetical protein
VNAVPVGEWPPEEMKTVVYEVLELARERVLFVQSGTVQVVGWLMFYLEPASHITSDGLEVLVALLDRGMLVRSHSASLVDETDEVISADEVSITATGLELIERLETPSRRR